MIIKTRGIVLRSQKYSETSLIVDVYTELKGMRSYIISGVRTPKARTHASLLQIGSLVHLVAYHQDNKDLTRIKEVRPAYLYRRVPFEVARSSVAMFISEVAQKALRGNGENEALFNYLFQTYQLLDETAHSVRNFHLHFLLEFAAHLGFRPGGDVTEDTPYFDLEEGYFSAQPVTHTNYLTQPDSRVLEALLNVPQAESHTVEMTRDQRRQILLQLLDFFSLHLASMPPIKSHLILEAVLDG